MIKRRGRRSLTLSSLRSFSSQVHNLMFQSRDIEEEERVTIFTEAYEGAFHLKE
jgi:hypothetical protein